MQVISRFPTAGSVIQLKMVRIGHGAAAPSAGQVQIDRPAGRTRKHLIVNPGDLVNISQPDQPRFTYCVPPQVIQSEPMVGPGWIA